MPARMRLRYGCSTPTAVSVGSPQLQTEHAPAGRANAASARNATATSEPRMLRTAIALRLWRVAVRSRGVVRHRLALVAFGAAAFGDRGALLVAAAGRDH